MKCGKWIERLPSLLDDDPGSPGRRELEAHLSQCPGCRGQWALLKLVKDASKELGGQEPGDDLWPGIQGELDGAEAAAPKKAAPLGPMVRLALGWGATLAVVLVAAVWMWPRQAVRDAPQAVSIGPAATVAEVPDVRAAEVRQPAPVRAPGKKGPSALAESLPPSEPRYLVDDLASAEAPAEPEARVQYIMPVLEPADLENYGIGQQYIMPAVCATGQEPF